MRKWCRNIVFGASLLVVSAAAGLYIVGTSAYWNFIKWLPEPISQFLVEAVHTLAKPILVGNVNDSEEQLDFYLAWLLCAVTLWLIFRFSALILRKTIEDMLRKSVSRENR